MEGGKEEVVGRGRGSKEGGERWERKREKRKYHSLGMSKILC